MTDTPSPPPPRDPTNPEWSGKDPLWLTMIKAWKIWIPLVITIAALFGVGVTVVDTDGDNVPDDVRVFKTLADPAGPAAPVVADNNQSLQPDEQAEDHKSAADIPGNMDLHEDMRDETPPGVSAKELADGAAESADLAASQLRTPRPPAGAQAYSCPNKYVLNRSALSAKRVGTMLHFTVSSPGSGGVIWRLFNTPSFGASSNKLLELDGVCLTLVPDSQKAWAQGAANSAYFSIEIVTNDLTRRQWLDSGIIKNGTLAAIVRDLNRSVGAPLKLVDPSGCAWTPGITDHDRAECGNTHWDVGKNFPWDVFIRQVLAGDSLHTPRDDARSGIVPNYLSAGEAAAAGTLIKERKIAARHHGWSKVDPVHLRNAVRAKASLGRANERLHAAAKVSGWKRLSRDDRHVYIHELI